jgi:hypothetical protein
MPDAFFVAVFVGLALLTGGLLLLCDRLLGGLG